MISVLVAEDERPIAKNIANIIQKTNPTFVVQHMAYDGEQAIELLQNNEIDLVFLDVNMPLVNGLEVLKTIKENGKQTLAVILTGYEDFEFARTALQNNAFDYLLKPLDKSQLSLVLQNVQQVVRKRDIQQSVFGKSGTALRSCYFGVSYFIGNGESILDAEIYQKMLLQEAQLIAALREEFGEAFSFIQTNSLSNERLLILDASCVAYQQRLQAVFARVQHILPCSMLMSEGLVPMCEVASRHVQYAKLLSHQLYFEQSSLWFGAQSLPDPAHNALEKTALQEITNAVQMKQIDGILQRLLYQKKATRKEIDYLVKCFVLTLSEKLKTENNYIDLEYDLKEVLDNTYSLVVLKKRLVEMVQSYFFWDMRHVNNAQSLALLVKSYIDKNYAVDISSEQLAQKMGYDQSYIRKAFKEIYGKLPSTYQVQMRVERAKVLLEKQISVKAVAREVGYEDPFYFSKVFKKATGFSPKEYSVTKNHCVPL